ncbi:hypothetical protein KF707C_13960 [Metapseudomonas furukawaii]|uniref:Uncharacterized protein n=2 Tax=Metapseudomonas furukawaii TaxID=1149133 RepID=A0AAD1BWE0_METFU|nr:hypothetical protein KF707C_13960 [Pseudomonas furukawaii]
MEGPYWVLTTMNSRYVIVSFKRNDGRPSLQYFLSNLESKAFPAPDRLQ